MQSQQMLRRCITTWMHTADGALPVLPLILVAQHAPWWWQLACLLACCMAVYACCIAWSALRCVCLRCMLLSCPAGRELLLSMPLKGRLHVLFEDAIAISIGY